MNSLTSKVNMAFQDSFLKPLFGGNITFEGFVGIEQLYESILTLVFVLGPILFVIAVGYMLFPKLKSLFGDVV